MLIVLPTRELALQVSAVLKKLIRFYESKDENGENNTEQKKLKHALIIGGHNYEGQFEELASNPDIVIATPGRLMEILKETEFSIKRVQYLVFDEAD